MSPERVSDVVKPALLRWARETSGLAQHEAARKIGVRTERLADWEAGGARPTVGQLRSAAGVYQRPLAAFFLAEAPARPAPLHDFRRLPAGARSQASSGLLLQMRRARRRRAVALRLLADLGREIPEVPLKAAVDSDAEAAAERTRAWLGAPPEQQRRWSGEYGPLNAWIGVLEDRGILVFQTGDVGLEEMRGFSLNERRLPVIVLNARDAPRGRVFTLMHELAHLMLGQGGVCDPLLAGRRAEKPDDQVEAFCNRTAGAILVPRHALLDHRLLAGAPAAHEWTEAEIRELADHFGVSRETVVRRLLILGRATEALYDRKREEYLAQYRSRAAGREGGFAPLFRVSVRDNGRRFTRLVLESLERGQITHADVSDYLGVRLRHLDRIASEVERAGAVR